MNRLVLLALLGLPCAAFAQDVEGFDAHGFRLAAFDGDLRDPLYAQRPGRMSGGNWFVGGVLEYAKAPLVRFEVNDAGDGHDREPWLDNLFAANLSVGVSPHERIRFDAAFPLYFTSTGPNGEANGVDPGDLRLSAMIAVVQPDETDEGFGLGLVGHFDAPTGATPDFLGNRTVAGGFDLSASWAQSFFTLTGGLGLQFNPTTSIDNLNGADALTGALGFGFLVHETTALNLEMHLSAPFARNRAVGSETPAEAIATVRHRRPSGFHLLGGAALGLSPGASAASYRLFLGAGFGKIGPSLDKDTDGDGIVDRDDRCKEEPETVNGYLDADGCPDALAALDVIVVDDNVRVVGADVALTGVTVDPASFQSANAARGFAELMPDTTVTGTATLGDCLAGTASAELVAGETAELAIELEPVRDATVKFIVVDEKEVGIPGATVAWKDPAPGCAPRGKTVLGDDGLGQQEVGMGTHDLFVTAAGFNIVREDVVVPAEGEITVKIQLKPTKVEVTGENIVILEKVFFDFDSDRIQARSFPLLDEVSFTILHHDLGMIEVAGHTDSKGRDAYNLDLSQRRADSVTAYLVSRGVAPDSLRAVGYGESKPIASNGSAGGRAKNRRVVFHILDEAKAEGVQGEGDVGE